MAKRLIDADALKCRFLAFMTGAHTTYLEDHNITMIVNQAPTVDAVKVIRCRNCIHDSLSTCPMCYIEGKTLVFVNHDPDFYCGNGERRCEE